MKQTARFEYLLRHLRQAAPYATPSKLGNLTLNLIELRLNVSRPRSLPPYIKIEPTPLCQLACPGCAHGTSDFKAQISNRMHTTLEEVRRIVEPMSRALFGVSLSFRGEPLLGKDLLPIIEYCHSKNVAVSFPTNLSLHLRTQYIARLVLSGVDTIFVSLDGTSDETYSQYRVGGDFGLVLENVRAIAAMKRQLLRSRPRLVWKFVVFDRNKHEVGTVESTYRQLGFDAYELVRDYHHQDVLSARQNHNADLVRHKKGCYWAWHTTVVRADGEVAPCCHWHDNFSIGNVKHQDIRALWRGDRYVRLRSGFKTMQPENMHPVCARCLGVKPTVNERPSLEFR
jgi:radical SAM protein with 4Fe4S-binding SPASM domain